MPLGNIYFMKHFFLLLVLIVTFGTSLVAKEIVKQLWSRDMKFATTVGIIWTGVIIHEELVWDMDRTFHFTDERWFEKDTSSAGSDKVGHTYSAYFLVRTLTPALEHYGYTKKEALWRSIWSSALLMTTMEITDGFTYHGFAVNDIVANTLGQYLGYVMEMNPSLDSKIAFRAMPFSAFETGKGKTSLSKHKMTVLNVKYFLALKASGFNSTKDTFLKYFDIHVGYDVYKNSDESIDRNGFVGVNINVGNVLREYSDSPFIRAFDLIQLPLTMSGAWFTPGHTTLPK